MSLKKNYFKYWGKASYPEGIDRKPDTTKPIEYHLLVYHCLDVAVVADCLLASTEINYLANLSKQLQVPENWLRKWLVFCIALHDLGKFFRSFQNLNCNDIQELAANNSKFNYTVKHDVLGLLYFKDLKLRKYTP